MQCCHVVNRRDIIDTNLEWRIFDTERQASEHGQGRDKHEEGERHGLRQCRHRNQNESIFDTKGHEDHLKNFTYKIRTRLLPTAERVARKVKEALERGIRDYFIMRTAAKYAHNQCPMGCQETETIEHLTNCQETEWRMDILYDRVLNCLNEHLQEPVEQIEPWFLPSLNGWCTVNCRKELDEENEGHVLGRGRLEIAGSSRSVRTMNFDYRLGLQGYIPKELIRKLANMRLKSGRDATRVAGALPAFEVALQM